MRTEESSSGPGAHGGIFATTHWSVVLAAGQHESLQAAEALEKLCRTYWYPLYAYVRRSGHSLEDAQDLTQEFFARLLARDSFAHVGPQKGKFRSFLLAALRHFLSDHWSMARAVKRGSGAEVLSLDALEAEERYRLEPVEGLDAGKIYERRWALTLLEQALQRLREESTAAGKTKLFEALESLVAGESDISCDEVAVKLGLTESAVKSSLHRLRERYRALVREEIAHTVAEPAEVEAEVRYLITVVSQ